MVPAVQLSNKVREVQSDAGGGSNGLLGLLMVALVALLAGIMAAWTKVRKHAEVHTVSLQTKVGQSIVPGGRYGVLGNGSLRAARTRKENVFVIIMNSILNGIQGLFFRAFVQPLETGPNVDKTVMRRDTSSHRWSPVHASEVICHSMFCRSDSCEMLNDPLECCIDVKSSASGSEPFCMQRDTLCNLLESGHGTTCALHCTRSNVPSLNPEELDYVCSQSEYRTDEQHLSLSHAKCLPRKSLKDEAVKNNNDGAEISNASALDCVQPVALKVITKVSAGEQNDSPCRGATSPSLSSGGLHQRRERSQSCKHNLNSPGLMLCSSPLTISIGPGNLSIQIENSAATSPLYPAETRDNSHPDVRFEDTSIPSGFSGTLLADGQPTKIGVCSADKEIDDLMDEEILLNPDLNIVPARDVALKKWLGRGSAGVVYEGSWRGRSVAVKVLIEQCQTPGQLNYFYKEVKLLMMLRHPNIIAFLGGCMRPPNLCIVQALAEQGSLHEVLHIRRLRPEYGKLLQILRDIAAAMAYCHSLPKPIIHRDLKTQNILLDSNGTALVADFGLAKVQEMNQPLTRRHGAGTVAYMAPESFEGVPVSEKCDVFSFGVIIWECITGQRPWKGAHPMQIVMAVAVEKIRPEIPRDCPKILRSLELTNLRVPTNWC